MQLVELRTLRFKGHVDKYFECCLQRTRWKFAAICYWDIDLELLESHANKATRISWQNFMATKYIILQVVCFFICERSKVMNCCMETLFVEISFFVVSLCHISCCDTGTVECLDNLCKQHHHQQQNTDICRFFLLCRAAVKQALAH